MKWKNGGHSFWMMDFFKWNHKASMGKPHGLLLDKGIYAPCKGPLEMFAELVIPVIDLNELTAASLWSPPGSEPRAQNPDL